MTYNYLRAEKNHREEMYRTELINEGEIEVVLLYSIIINYI